VRERTERACGLVAAAGVAVDPARPWPEWVAEVGARAKSARRHAELLEERIPGAPPRARPPRVVEGLRAELGVLESETAAPAAATARPGSAIEAEITAARELLDTLHGRTNLLLREEERWRRDPRRARAAPREREVFQPALEPRAALQGRRSSSRARPSSASRSTPTAGGPSS